MFNIIQVIDMAADVVGCRFPEQLHLQYGRRQMFTARKTMDRESIVDIWLG